MTSRGVSTLKFVGTVSLGLLTVRSGAFVEGHDITAGRLVFNDYMHPTCFGAPTAITWTRMLIAHCA